MIPQEGGRNSDNNAFYYEDEGKAVAVADAIPNRLYALAAPNASHRVVLLEMLVSPTATAGPPGVGPGSGDEVGVREIAYLEGLSYGDEFTERLCESGGEDGEGGAGGFGGGDGYVLVAALVSANRRAIYRIPLKGAAQGRG